MNEAPDISDILPASTVAADGKGTVPELAPEGELATSPARFMNRELSWLQFNLRVLDRVIPQ